MATRDQETTTREQRQRQAPREAPEARYAEDLSIVDGCIAGRRESWLALIEKHERTIYFAILNTLRNYGAHAPADRVEDMQADLMIALVKDDFRKLRKYSGRCKLDQWLKVVAGNYTIDQLRKRRPTLSLDQDTEPSRALRRSLHDARPLPDASIQKRQMMQALRGLYDELPEADRRFVHLFYHQERSFDEIADAMNTTVGAIYARKNRVRKKLLALAAERGLI